MPSPEAHQSSDVASEGMMEEDTEPDSPGKDSESTEEDQISPQKRAPADQDTGEEEGDDDDDEEEEEDDDEGEQEEEQGQGVEQVEFDGEDARRVVPGRPFDGSGEEEDDEEEGNADQDTDSEEGGERKSQEGEEEGEEQGEEGEEEVLDLVSIGEEENPE